MEGIIYDVEYTQSRIPMKKVCARSKLNRDGITGGGKETTLLYTQQGLDRGDYKEGTADIYRRNTYGKNGDRKA